MAKIPVAIGKSIAQYLSLAQVQYPLQTVFLFGSQASGKAREWSDIDLALVSQAFANDPTNHLVHLMKLAAQVDWRIEPHVFSPGDFESSHPLVAEILRGGVRILPQRRKRELVSRRKRARQTTA